jgi:nucleoside triphosphate pyrophosphatase
VLVLASASPRRHQLLHNAGIAFVVQPANIPEVPNSNESPKALAERLAREKAQAVFHDRPTDSVLGADTVVVVDEQILGKPENPADAARMLRLLSGRTHTVITAVCLLGPPEKANHQKSAAMFQDVRSETTLVTMESLGESEIRGYVATGEPMDKAGAYAIQGYASRWISRIEGDYFNVVGLPVCLVLKMLRQHGVCVDCD